MQQAALGVGGVDDVDGLGPAVEGAVDVGDGTGAQQGGQDGEAEVAADAGRVAEGEGLAAAVRLVPDDDGAARGLQDLDLDRVGAG